MPPRLCPGDIPERRRGEGLRREGRGRPAGDAPVRPTGPHGSDVGLRWGKEEVDGRCDPDDGGAELRDEWREGPELSFFTFHKAELKLQETAHSEFLFD